jgi:hypothetical protein
LKYLLGILNSSLMSFYFTRSTPKAVRKLFPKVILADLRRFPIKRAGAQTQAPIIHAVDRMLEAQLTLMEIATDFTRLAEAELGIGIGIGGSGIRAWHELDRGRFLDAAKRGAGPKAFGLAEESRWIRHFETEKEKTLVPKAAIARLDAEIDGMVFDLYGLAEGEMATVDAV